MKRFLLPLFPLLALLLLCNATTPQPEFRIVKPEEIPTLPRAHSRRIDRIIIHCSAVGPRQTSSARQIDQWHRRKGWLMIGYHYVIRRDGTIETGRPPDMIGAHTLGWNKYSLGICYEGGLERPSQPPLKGGDGKLVPADTRTPEQKASLLALFRYLKTLYPNATIHGHNEFCSKACPCFDVRAEYPELLHTESD